jgi:NDP-sugar pyrophosphorylase family protein
MKGMILAAGLSTRLGALGSERPKPLFPVADVPLVRYALALLRGHGVSEVIVNTHHLGAQLERELGAAVAYSREAPHILGTGGGLRQAATFLRGGPFWLVNGKIVIDVDLAAVAAHHARTGALATLVVRADADAARWGAVDVDEAAGRVRSLRGAGQHMFTGIHLVEPELLDLVPDGPSDIIADAYMPALARGAVLGAFVQDGYFAEHSTPARYLQGNVNVLRGMARLPQGPPIRLGVAPGAHVDPSAVLREPLLIAPGAEVGAGCQIGPDAVIGARARVGAGVQLERVVVWPGAVVAQDARDAIVTDRGVFPVQKA